MAAHSKWMSGGKERATLFLSLFMHLVRKTLNFKRSVGNIFIAQGGPYHATRAHLLLTLQRSSQLTNETNMTFESTKKKKTFKTSHSYIRLFMRVCV